MKFSDKYFSRILIPAILLIVIGIFVTSCQSSENNNNEGNSGRNLRVGYLDADKLMKEFPELVKFMEEKQKQSTRVRTMLTSGKELTEAQKEQIKKTTIKFMEDENRYLEKFVEKVRESAKEVAEEKKLDLVLNNSSTEPVIEYGGIDITEDVRAEINQKQDDTGKKPAGEKPETEKR